MLGLIDKPTPGQLLYDDTNVVGLRLCTVATGEHRANSGIVDQYVDRAEIPGDSSYARGAGVVVGDREGIGFDSGSRGKGCGAFGISGICGRHSGAHCLKRFAYGRPDASRYAMIRRGAQDRMLAFARRFA